MAYEQITFEVKDGIGIMTLNRPDKMNAFTGTMMSEMIDCFDRINKDDDVRAVIVTGAGDRAFCAGADLSAGAKTFDYEARDDRPDRQGATKADGSVNWSDPSVRDGGGLLTLKIFESLKPVIAAVNGAAVGIGVTMQLPMDIRIASTKARFGFVFARRGIVPEACSTYFLPRIVGIATATEWCFTGRVFDAKEAKERGLVTHLVEPEELMPAALKLAHEIADNTAPVSVALTRQMLWKLLGADHPMEAHKVDSRGVFARGRQADAKEGVVSFLEKRTPVYPNKVSQDMPGYFPWWDERKYS